MSLRVLALFSILAGGAEAAESSVDPILRLEHGLFLQHIQLDPSAAMVEYRAALEAPQAPPRTMAEARVHLAECFELRDCPAAALALHQMNLRLLPDAQPFAKISAERAATLPAVVEAAPQFPCRHTLSYLGDLLILLQSSLRDNDVQSPLRLLARMDASLGQLQEELKLAPNNELRSRAEERSASLRRLGSQRATVAAIKDASARGAANIAIRLAGSDPALLALLDRRTLFVRTAELGAIIAARREAFVRAVAVGSTADAKASSASLSALVQPIAEGPGGVRIVQTAQATVALIGRVMQICDRADWPAARLALADELERLCTRYHPAADVRLDGGDVLTPMMQAQLIRSLTHVKEALDVAHLTERTNDLLPDINSAIAAAQPLLAEWSGQPAALELLQATLSTLQRARDLAATDEASCRALLGKLIAF